MKKSFVFSLLISIPIIVCINLKTIKIDQTANSILADISYTKRFDKNPSINTNENLRIITHLKYVENLLRKKDVSHLSKKQKQNREKLLSFLNEYWKAGNFPKNYEYPNKRVPCFIDKTGNICAVGYLIEKTAGRQVSEEINSKYKFQQLLSMNDSKIDNWIKSSGLTKEECAMIQPQYGYYYPPNYINSEYALASSMLIGTNLSVNAINGYQISKRSKNKTVPIIGLISGVSQITIGGFGLRNSYYGNKHQNLSMLNIGIGTSTIIFSTWNLIANRKPKTRAYFWNIYSFPTPSKNTGLGFSFTKRF